MTIVSTTAVSYLHWKSNQNHLARVGGINYFDENTKDRSSFDMFENINTHDNLKESIFQQENPCVYNE